MAFGVCGMSVPVSVEGAEITIEDVKKKLQEVEKELEDSSGYDLNKFEKMLEEVLTGYAKAKVINSVDDAISEGYSAIADIPHNVVTDLCVVSQTTDAIAISFNSVPEGQVYRINYWARGSAVKNTVYAIDEQAAKEGKATTKKIYATIYNLANGEYTFQVETGNYSELGKARFATEMPLSGGNAYASLKAATAPDKPDKVKVNKLEMNADGDGYISLSFSGLNTNMDDIYKSQVYVYSYKGNKLLSFTGSATGASFTSPKIENNRFFTVKVRGVYKNEDGTSLYGAWSDEVLTGGAFTSPAYTSENGKISAKWGVYKGAEKYLVYISTKKNSGYKKAASTTEKKAVISKFNGKKLKAGSRYYVKVRAMKTVDGEACYIESTPKRILVN